jgi:hypothetical protein
MLGILQPPTASSALPQRPEPESWRLEPLAGWHLPLLNGPTFLPLQPYPSGSCTPCGPGLPWPPRYWWP